MSMSVLNMGDNFVLIRWAGAKTLSIIEEKCIKTGDALKIGRKVTVYHHDLKNRKRSYEATILGFGSAFAEMESLKGNFQECDDSNDPIDDETSGISQSALKRTRKPNPLYANDFVDVSKGEKEFNDLLDPTERYNTRSAAKKRREESNAEKAEIEKAKKNLFDDVLDMECLPIVSATNVLLNCNSNLKELQLRIDDSCKPIQESSHEQNIVQYSSSNVHHANPNINNEFSQYRNIQNGHNMPRFPQPVMQQYHSYPNVQNGNNMQRFPQPVVQQFHPYPNVQNENNMQRFPLQPVVQQFHPYPNMQPFNMQYPQHQSWNFGNNVMIESQNSRPHCAQTSNYVQGGENVNPKVRLEEKKSEEDDSEEEGSEEEGSGKEGKDNDNDNDNGMINRIGISDDNRMSACEAEDKSASSPSKDSVEDELGEKIGSCNAQKKNASPSLNKEDLQDAGKKTDGSCGDAQEKNADEMRIALSSVYGVLSKSRNTEELCNGLDNVVQQFRRGGKISFPSDQSNSISMKAVFNTEKVKLVELVHGSGIMVSKTDKDLAIREANGDQTCLVKRALDTIYGKELASFSALGTRNNKAIDGKIYKIVYLFATHNKQIGATDLTKTEYNKIINDHCTAVRKSLIPKDERPKGRKGPKLPTKPKTKSQIKRQMKMKAISEERKKEKLARTNK